MFPNNKVLKKTAEKDDTEKHNIKNTTYNRLLLFLKIIILWQ